MKIGDVAKITSTIVDFNESEIGHSMHYYVTRKDTGELIAEKSVIL